MLRKKARRLGLTQSKNKGKKLAKSLAAKGTTAQSFVDDIVQNEGESVNDCSTAKKWWYVRDAKGVISSVITNLRGRTLEVPIEVHKNMKMDYCSWDGDKLTINDMAKRYGLQRKEFFEYKTVHAWTKHDDGFIDEDLLERSVEDLTENLLAQKKRQLEKSYNAEVERATKEDAGKWRGLQTRIWQPFKDLASHIEIRPVSKLSYKKPSSKSVRKLIINACDWQIGEISQAMELNRGGDWSTERAVKAVERYVENIAKHIGSSNCNYDEILVCDLGDLGHGLNGMTAHGTPLECDRYRQEQVHAIINGFTALINCARQVAPKVSVYHVEDNHLGFGSTLIFDQIAAWYGGANPVKDVNVVHNYKPVEYVAVGKDTLLVFLHGKTGRPGTKEGLGTSPVQRERNAYYLVMEAVRKYPQHRNVNLITGHVHHRIVEEFPDFTIHTLSSIVAGDLYSDQLMVSGSKPSQTIFEVNLDNGFIYPVPIDVGV